MHLSSKPGLVFLHNVSVSDWLITLVYMWVIFLYHFSSFNLIVFSSCLNFFSTCPSASVTLSSLKMSLPEHLHCLSFLLYSCHPGAPLNHHCGNFHYSSLMMDSLLIACTISLFLFYFLVCLDYILQRLCKKDFTGGKFLKPWMYKKCFLYFFFYLTQLRVWQGGNYFPS